MARLYVAKTYKVEYGVTSAFNWKNEEFHYLLDALEVGYCGETWDATFDVMKDEFEDGLKKLKDFDNLEDWQKADIEESLKNLTYSREEVIDLFELYLKESDPNNDFIHFSFI